MWCGPNENPPGRNFLLAVEKANGKTVWESEQKHGSWSTPVIAKVNGQDQLILGMTKYLRGFDPKSGKELWFCEGTTELVYTSALYANGIAVAMSGYGGAALAVRLGETPSGDITKSRLWRHPRNIQRVRSGARRRTHHPEENGVPTATNSPPATKSGRQPRAGTAPEFMAYSMADSTS